MVTTHHCQIGHTCPRPGPVGSMVWVVAMARPLLRGTSGQPANGRRGVIDSPEIALQDAAVTVFNHVLIDGAPSYASNHQ
jgi:hypothetical protein